MEFEMVRRNAEEPRQLIVHGGTGYLFPLDIL